MQSQLPSSPSSVPSSPQPMDTRKPPNRTQTTLSSTWSNLDEEGHATGVGQPGLFHFLNAASQYADVFDEHSEESDSDDSPADPALPIVDITHGLTALNLQALSSMANLAKLSANTYNKPVYGPFEHEATLHDSPTSTPPSEPESQGPDPNFIMHVLLSEFGPLAAEGEKEEFISEADGALLQEATILGTIHLTTHRVTFHASLLSTRPDLESKVIKSGAVIVHRSGLHRKQRIWVELTHDMLSTYRNATEEARARPIRTVLLSNIKEIQDINPAHPTTITITFNKSKGLVKGKLEIDTPESAAEWLRELKSALFLYRHSKKAVFGDSSTPTIAPADYNTRREVAGVRICIPLHRIENLICNPWYDFARMISLDVNNNSDSTVAASASSEEGGSSTSGTGQQEFKFAVVQNDPSVNFPCLVKTAKEQFAARKSPSTDTVFVDWGSLTFADKDEEDVLLPTGVRTQEEKAGDKRASLRTSEMRMRKKFALDDETEVFINRGYLSGRVCSSGFFLISDRFICFWSKSYASTDIKYRFDTRDVNSASASSTTIFGHSGIALEIRGHKTLTFAFAGKEVRDTVVRRVNSAAARAKGSSTPPRLPRIDTANPDVMESLTATLSDTASSTEIASEAESHSTAVDATECGYFATEALSPISRAIDHVRNLNLTPSQLASIPKAINIPSKILHHIASKHFVCLTIGSRGDVQPYIALGLGLQKEGHTVTIVTHEEYKGWVEGFGIAHRTAGGDPGALMQLSVEHSMFSPQFFKESLGKFRGWLDDLLMDSWLQCQDADVLIESPSAMAGVHIAEALKIPYIRAFTMPWTRTVDYPHAFLSPPIELSGSFNYSTYVLFDNIFWKALSGQVNRWRVKTLKVKRTDIDTLAQAKIPFIYNFSPSVVPKPLDWKDTTTVSGYWFLDNPDLNWTPPPGLTEFIAKAKADEKPIVYIGFGSIVVPHPHAMTRSIVKAVIKSDVRAIVSKGWSDRMASDKTPEVEMPPECYSLDKVPHDWLFPQIDAALHHGGAGTTGASLRAGIPTLIKPWFGDQFFWASRVQKLGAGLRVDSLGSSDLAAALKKATSSRVMKEKAASVGEKIRAEDGVNTAIKAIYTYLPRAALDRTTL